MMTEVLTAYLKAGATAAGTRIFPVIAAEGTDKPYLVYQRITANDENVLSGDSGLINTRLQLDAYGSTYAAAQALAAQVDALMAAWLVQNVSVGAQDFYEQDTKLHRVQADYSIWHS